ncbi:MAG: hypothetical protein CO175_06785 [Verrucomicrobia bacterium CG_4_9_14_3_um_filter_43_20]|nr:MAG: hypothetical protein AUJ82_07820 [Verrucomicrobia bacterium CG1_02_43_26]PIP59890.1 MAG: hypothetical protein COX01_01255 [Verrucomicrobia bacterium CG22_combo_CG10-13_8_21_14_all_43_17]PIY62747.1 MAG: hypothetical protein COY94_01160 [Verrucomicrobia bacterium CG_4_10_14_0_8_um_filter_43_34]PJA43686.1 MAG: hypothetical protein CO175_06785 [Verrucomicrobia bacterium CG_4_9_14_3_um_filter_43_20]
MNIIKKQGYIRLNDKEAIKEEELKEVDNTKLRIMNRISLLPTDDSAKLLKTEKCILLKAEKPISNCCVKFIINRKIIPATKGVLSNIKTLMGKREKPRTFVSLGDVWVYKILKEYSSVETCLNARLVCDFFRKNFDPQDLKYFKKAIVYRERVISTQSKLRYLRYDELYNLNRAGERKALSECNWSQLKEPEALYHVILEITGIEVKKDKWLLERNYNLKFTNACFNVEFVKKETENKNSSLEDLLKEKFPLSDWQYRLIYKP